MDFFEIFILSFLIALSGAMSPGPLLTYTIYKALQSKRRAYLIGILIWIGHAILEFILMVVLLIGLSSFISDRPVVILIGLLGGIILMFFGISLLRDIWLKKIDLTFLTPENKIIEEQERAREKTSLIQQPTLGGALVSMSNPYWWIWWAVVGLNFMTQFSVGLLNLEF